MPCPRASRRIVVWLAAVVLFAGTFAQGEVARASITGVCPDGSIFIVQHASAIPCRDHKEGSNHACQAPRTRP